MPCGNATTETRLPPTCPGFDPAAEMRAAWQLGLNVVVRLEPQYSAWGCTGEPSCQAAVCFGARPGQENWALPDPSQSWSGHLRATHDPGSNHTSYKAVARSYARVAASLPRPPPLTPPCLPRPSLTRCVPLLRRHFVFRKQFR